MDIKLNVDAVVRAHLDETSDISVEYQLVPKSILEPLLQNSRMLSALWAAGVENWSGYSEAENLNRDELFQ